jgi:hypothetical protein
MREEESGHRRRLIELSQREVRRSHPADPPPGRAGLRRPASPSGCCARCASRWCAARPLRHGSRNQPFLRTRRRAHPGRQHSPAFGRLGPGGAGTRKPRRRAHRRQAARLRQRAGRGRQPPAVRAADRAAGLGRLDGWIGFHACPGFRRRLRHAPAVGRVSGGLGGIDRRRHQHGIRRSPLRRWQPHRPRPSLDARPGLRPDDRGSAASATPCRL